MSTKINIITSCYNSNRYLENFLNNFIEQTVFDICELVIHLNKPTDYELKLIKKFSIIHPNNIKYLISKDLVPYSKSWNICISNCKHNILCIWNVDDLRTPTSIEDQYQFIQNNEQYSLVYGNFIEVNQYDKKIGNLHTFHFKNIEEELCESFIFGPFFMFKKNVFKEILMFDEQLKSGADYDFALRFSRKFKSAYIDKILGYYTNENLGLSTSGNIQLIERTLIERRFGIFKKIEFPYFFMIKNYKSNFIKNNDEWFLMDDYQKISFKEFILLSKNFLIFLFSIKTYIFFKSTIKKLIKNFYEK